MKTVNVLDFLNDAKIINTLSCATCDNISINLLDYLSEEEQFLSKIDLGLVFVKHTTLQNIILVDGLQRLLSISLLLHAICECYKKTSTKNDKAIEYIKTNYLISNSKMKLRLSEAEQIIYEKIVNGERLSGKEKKSPIFILLHKMWSQIKEQELQASDILKMMKKVSITLVDVDVKELRDIYVSINKDKRDLNQYLLIDDFINKQNLSSQWNRIKRVFKNNEQDLNSFFKDFMTPKFNFKSFSENKLYEYFVNYFETMTKYLTNVEVLEKIYRSALNYNNIININFIDDDIKKAFVQIKMHKGEDTYAYILNIYEDYEENNINKATFLEILSTIDEYLKNRLKTPNNVVFNDLINYLNAFIICK